MSPPSLWRDSSERQVTCIACGATLSREDAREYDKYGDRWDRDGKEFEYLFDILPRLKTRESTKWIFGLRVSSVLKYAFAWNVSGSHRVVTNGVRYSAYSPVNGAFLPAYSERLQNRRF